jgi:exonuclease SbcC
MLPVRLELRNFLAYRSPDPISFDGLNLACLTGPNGAGKSSLLDAMTWALWGNARTNKDDDLIHMGQEEMHVIFDFRQDQAIYRVVRKRSKKGRGQGSLDLFAWADDSNDYRLISESTMRETQLRINQLLRLDYETFVHSAFLQQGKADSFTVKTPGERKKILSDILGLSRWNDYETQAKQNLQAIATELSVIDGRIAEIEQEETAEPSLRYELELATQQVDEARQAREVAEEGFAEVANAPAAMQNAQSQLVVVQRRIREAEHDQAALDSELDQQRQRLASYQEVLAARQTIEEGYAQLEEARRADSDMGYKLTQQVEIKERLNELTYQLNAERADLEAQVEVSLDRIREAEQAIEAGQPVAAQLAEIEIEIERLEQRRAERDDLSMARETLLTEDATLRAQNKTLKVEMDSIKERLDMIESADGAVCPVCNQPLDEAHRARIAEAYLTDGKARGDTHRANKTRLDTIAQTIAQHERTTREIEQDLRGFDALKSQEGGLQERLLISEQAEQRLITEQAALEDLERMLAEENFSLELRAQIAALRDEIDGLGYDKETHTEAREALQILSRFDVQMRQLETAIQSLPVIELNVQNLETRHERNTIQIRELCDDALAQEQEIEVLQVRVEEAKRRQSELNRLRIQERSVTEKLIGVQQQLNAIDAARKRKQELQLRCDALREDESMFAQLKEAFGKNGIPAMIIEAAIPELEDATNKLLMRMTDGRMHVRFDTQKQNKIGTVSETLDILISDELGTRSYEMFSGGEGFRVNFALRIALSQFLTRRAGARLQTLVIDEGFGSQDDIGRERLVEAINAIRHDFDLILIVTHIDELRDAFPVHIEVRKTASGSTVSVR